MLTLLATAVIYNTIFFCSFLLLQNGKKHLNSKSYLDVRIFFAYFLVWIVSVIRYDIGADYENTVYDIIEVKNSIKNGATIVAYITESMKEPGLFFFTLIFNSFPSTHLWVIAAYFTIFIYFLYKVFNAYNIHKWGIIVLYLSIIIFQTWDWIRQGTAMAIVLYAIHLYESSKYKKFMLTCILSAFFHYSSLFVIPFVILFKRFHISSKLMVLILCAILALSISGLFKAIYGMLISLIPFYGEIYLESSKYAMFEEQSYTSVPFLLNALWLIFVVYSSKENYKLWTQLLFVGAILFMISGGSLLIDRLAWYFTCSQLIIVPYVINFNRSKIFRFLLTMFIISHIVLLNRRFFIQGELRGCVPYQTILSNEADYLQFRYREN